MKKFLIKLHFGDVQFCYFGYNTANVRRLPKCTVKNKAQVTATENAKRRKIRRSTKLYLEFLVTFYFDPKTLTHENKCQ